MFTAARVLGIRATGVPVGNKHYNVEWVDKRLIISDVETFEDVMNILRPDTVQAAAPAAPPVEAAPSPPPVSPAPVSQPANPMVAPSTVSASEPLQTPTAPPSGSTPAMAAEPAIAAPSTAAPVVSDYEVFRVMTSLTQVVNEVMRRGAATFEEVQAAVAAVKESGVCALLARTANLATRLRNTCAALEIPGAI